MNPRERFLASILVAILVAVGGGVAFMQLLWKPRQEYRDRIANEQEEVANKMVQLKKTRRTPTGPSVSTAIISTRR